MKTGTRGAGKYTQQMYSYFKSDRFRKSLIMNIPFVAALIFADRASCLFRISEGGNFSGRMLYTMSNTAVIFHSAMPCLDRTDLLVGTCVAVVFRLLVIQKKADSNKLRKGSEYGSARWGTREGILPFITDAPWMNIYLTTTESLTMESRPKKPKYARNKNFLVIGCSGFGKTRFFVKPSVMQMNCSMVLTNPKMTIIKIITVKPYQIRIYREYIDVLFIRNGCNLGWYGCSHYIMQRQEVGKSYERQNHSPL